MAERLHIEPICDFALAAIHARKEVAPKSIGAALGSEAPDGPSWSISGVCCLLGTGPRRWLAWADRWTPDWESTLRERLLGLASVSDQSSGYEIIRLSGPGARGVLQRGAQIDLHPDTFAPGTVAVTTIAHVGVTIWQLDNSPSYHLAFYRSYASSFHHWLDAAI